jgi:putative NADH-flavin reductase
VRILVIGATSGIGRKTVEEALARGHTVRAMSRGAASLAATDRLEPYPGDATSEQDVDGALEGVDAVVQALGLRTSRIAPWQRITLFSRSTDILIQAMRKAGLSRLVAVTGFGAGDSRTALSGPERIGHRALLGPAYRDKDRQEMSITASGLDWTIVRPTILTSGGKSGRYRVLRAGEWRNGLVSRADVADFIVGALEDGTCIREAVVLAR